ncbi:uncharacterized protein LOC123783281 isoform X1 [Ursus americanus]|uniref:uncharacterized protein LOC123783281 isoform X1 n=1 Tax=Ursus americanus TaxID=9643 RepID=UPI001E67A2AA|nr:uncharacterized protein LOC123783281 isoform X1 [Ursus americanus]
MDSLGPPTPFRGRKVMDQKALVPGNPAFQRAERTAMKPSVHTQPSEGQACRTDTWRDWSPHAGSRSPWDSIGTQVLPVMDPLTLAAPSLRLLPPDDSDRFRQASPKADVAQGAVTHKGCSSACAGTSLLTAAWSGQASALPGHPVLQGHTKVASRAPPKSFVSLTSGAGVTATEVLPPPVPPGTGLDARQHSPCLGRGGRSPGTLGGAADRPGGTLTKQNIFIWSIGA